MIIASIVARGGSPAMLTAALLCAQLPSVARAQEPANSAAPMPGRISALIPDLEAYGFGTFLGLLLDRDVGLVLLSNGQYMGLPVALGMWALDRLLDNPVVDHVADALKAAKDDFASLDKLFARPASPRPFPPLAFAQFEVGQDGKLGVLRLTTEDGQPYEFRRE